jgi:hypothetical protein
MTTQKGGENKWQKRKAEPKEKAVKEKAVKAAAEVVADAVVGTEASRRLCEEISSMTGGRCLLGFSRGKDSIAAWLYLRWFFSEVIPFHCSSIPHLSFVDESLDYYEDVFKTKIIRCLSGEITSAMADLIYQPLEDEDTIDSMELWEYNNHDIINLLQKQYGHDLWCAFGINITDSIDRRIYVQKNQGRNEERKTFYPCFDWSKKQIMQTVDEAGIKLPGDYRLANRSLAGLPNFRHLCRMEEVYPQDMEKIELWFPFIRAQLARNEFRREKALASRAQEQDQFGGGYEAQNPTGR